MLTRGERVLNGNSIVLRHDPKPAKPTLDPWCEIYCLTIFLSFREEKESVHYGRMVTRTVDVDVDASPSERLITAISIAINLRLGSRYFQSRPE